MTSAELDSVVRRCVPGSRDAAASPIVRGGSDRDFFRCHAGGRSVIVVIYGAERAENGGYGACADFLRSEGVRVPAVLAHDASRRVLILEDLGTEDLWTHREEPWPVRRGLYEEALREVAALHGASVEEAARRGLLQKEFDEALYRWEQGYFFDNFLARHAGFDAEALAPWRSHPGLRELARGLAARPRRLVHRDFQSQNILIHGGRAWLIDFQGMRPGLPHYDLASLLYDPYVTMTDAERVELAAFYRSLGVIGEDDVTFGRVFRACAIQRLMQALGAYGFLGHVKRRPCFLDYVPVAAERLAVLLEGDDALRGLAGMVRNGSRS